MIGIINYGLGNLSSVKNTVESNFKEHWGVLRQEILTKNTTGNRVGGDMSDFKVGEYDFKRLKKMEEINQSSVFTLKEITEEGGKPHASFAYVKVTLGYSEWLLPHLRRSRGDRRRRCCRRNFCFWWSHHSQHCQVLWCD